ncbi:MAG: YbhB/YbcL family Raf kinase inhibitor-like protein [Candidatus Thiodiazotropha lotti]|uniref:Phosphatidylethanolamine-binding protein n=2 Tax=Candidatus Thiodiazotropha TaxID=1913444 RepID=A0A1E2V3M5_9GAMM|nr:YbhB/YbcL family Raf kinase inhibitor-like protein [Candidatus Thiodiazotropha endoloripes]MCG7904836.1 YbhB/YbcL family Raf kinase inhibitor-like protein [Candidatus Thiodiazotropha weberae]MCG7923820.1 YbhB/YbcL family Raf kinase inhibitor-like protein [Candidatus Thiodiazotropha lotti]MCG7916102.1 YbhB/YbcL family Raf kinase inhibitor-like protein [Candidatus Thiodiazotropha weberae]MCG7932839.1 YbhB/YbcL family Raf kinase inhibitor-like protein [Candidatus Thiodiazotropha lotti]MCG79399
MPSYKLLIAAMTLTLSPLAQGFELTSTDIEAGKPMPKAQEYQGFGCNGGNTSPQLTWHNAPKGTKSFAVTAYDPDAPTGSGWWHWIAYNIPLKVKELPSGTGNPRSEYGVPGMVQHRTDYGSAGFGGACPPKGDKAHRYQFRVFALDVKQLEISPESSAALVGYMLNSHKLGVAELEALYQR